MSELKPNETLKQDAAEACAGVDDCVKHHPGAALVAALGAGLVIGLLARALRPPPEPTPRQRIVRLLEEFEDRLREITAPALHKAGAYAGDQVDSIAESLHSGEARLERMLSDAGARLRGLFH
jgi:ElaB/YqjD/DUF883 family membrane-anchored ribosome-binding protein